MAYNLTTIVAKVQRRIRDTRYSGTEIAGYINDAQNDALNEYLFEFMKTSQAYTVAIGVADITNGVGLPANLDQIIDLVDTTTGGEQVITYMEQTELDRLYPDNQDTTLHPNGKPLYWYREGTYVKVFPAPAAAYTFRLKYYKKPTILVADADVPEVPSNFEEMLVSGASYRVLQAKDQYDQAGIHQNKYDEILQKMVMRYALPQNGRPTTMRINRHSTMRQSTTRWR